jgi:Uma2 family endonuclease
VAGTATLISVEEYLRTGYKPACEYIDGVLRPKTMPTFRHGNMELVVCNSINRFTGFVATPELTVRIREGKYLVPDVAVQKLSELQEPYPIKPVHLCVEVMSPEDRFSETVAKCEEYHAWGVPYCWILDPESRQCWQYHAGGRPNQVPTEGRIAAGPVVIGYSELFTS